MLAGCCLLVLEMGIVCDCSMKLSSRVGIMQTILSSQVSNYQNIKRNWRCPTKVNAEVAWKRQIPEHDVQGALVSSGSGLRTLGATLVFESITMKYNHEI